MILALKLMNKLQQENKYHYLLHMQFPFMYFYILKNRKGLKIINSNSQGMTIDRVETKLSSIFEYGQTYVALSRCTSLEGLCIVGFDKSKIKAHPKVVKFYESLNNINKSNVNNIDDKELIKIDNNEDIIDENDDEDFINKIDINEIYGIKDNKIDNTKKELNNIKKNENINANLNNNSNKNFKSEIKINSNNINSNNLNKIKEQTLTYTKNDSPIQKRNQKEIISLLSDDSNEINKNISNDNKNNSNDINKKKLIDESLLKSIVGSECMNQSKKNNLTKLFSKSSYLESDEKEKLLIYLPFLQKVNISRILITVKDESIYFL
jgi:hypothetical protein